MLSYIMLCLFVGMSVYTYNYHDNNAMHDTITSHALHIVGIM